MFSEILLWCLKGSAVIAAGWSVLYAGRRWGKLTAPNFTQAGVLFVLLAACCPWSLPIVIFYERNEPAVAAETSANVAATNSVIADSITSPALLPQPPSDSLSQPSPLAAELEPTTLPRSPFSTAFSQLASNVLPWLTSIWLVGIACIVIRSLLRYVSFLRHARQRCKPPTAWQGEWDEVQQSVRLQRKLPLFATPALGPMLAWLPAGMALLIPAPIWQELSCRQRRTILRHELAHYQRCDILRAATIRLLALPFWWHPGTWQLLAWFDEAAEFACDRSAVGKHDALAYAQALERLVTIPVSNISPALGTSAHSHPLVQRVRRVLSPQPSEDSVMKKTLTALALAAIACISLIQIRLQAADKADVTFEDVKSQFEAMQGKLQDLKDNVDQVKQEAAELKQRVEAHLQSLKDLAADPSQLSNEAQELIEEIKSSDETKQLGACEKAQKLSNQEETLLVYGYLAKEGAGEKVRRKALALAAPLGEAGLPVYAHAFEGLSIDDRLYAVEQLVEQKQELHPAVFARLAHVDDETIRKAAVVGGLQSKDPLSFMALSVDGNETIVPVIFAKLSLLKGEDLRVALFAAAFKGPEDYLPEVATQAAALQADGYPIIAAVFHRATPKSRATLVKLYRKSDIAIEKLLVSKALSDDDEALRKAALEAAE